MNRHTGTPSVREIRNVWLCRLNDGVVQPGFCDLSIRDGRIEEIRPNDYQRYLRSGDPDRSRSHAESGGKSGHVVDGEATVVDAEARVATPPLVNFHEHLYSRLAKGLALPGPMQDFRGILENLWWRLDQALDADMVEACARLGSAEAIRSGVTYLFDHHSSPNFIRGSLSMLAEILSEAGLRSVLCLETSDRHGDEVTEACFEEQRRFIRQRTGEDQQGLLGLHAPFTLTDKTLETALSLCNELAVGIHIHLAEDLYEQQFSRESFGCSAAVRLHRFGLLRHPGILAHGVHLEEEDWDVVGQGQCALAMNPDSNLNNAVGLGRYTEIPDSVSLVAGTDGMHACPSRSIKQMFLLHRHQGGAMPQSFAFIRRLYFDQVRFVRRFFPDFPALNPGDRADLAVWDYRPPSPLSEDNFWGHLIYGILEAPAWTVCMRGKALLADHKLLGIDFASISRKAAAQGARLFEKLGVTHHG